MMRKIAYWVTTVLIGWAYLAGGVIDLAQPEDMMKDADKLGFPRFFFSILGFWKVCGGIVVLSPRLPRMKEWAYAGILINLTGASVTHIAVNDGIADIITPLVLLSFAVASWALRPDSRKLAGPWV